MVHAVFLRSTVAHGRIASLDVEQARATDGVVAIVTGAELAQITNPMQLGPETPNVLRPVFTPLATDRVRYVGDPVALILAESRYAAEDARDVIFVEYDLLDAVATIEQAEDPAGPALFEDVGSNVLYSESVEFGDPDAAFAGARVVRETFYPQRVAPRSRWRPAAASRITTPAPATSSTTPRRSRPMRCGCCSRACSASRRSSFA